MGIDLRWEDEKGNILAELPDGNFLVEKFLPHFEDKEFPCLRFVDPSGDTTFNLFQITQIADELEWLLTDSHKPEVQRHLLAVLEFVRQARDKVHTYIKFYGD